MTLSQKTTSVFARSRAPLTALALVLAGTLAATGTATARVSPSAAFDACVSAVAQASGANELALVRNAEAPGRGNEEFWFNAVTDAPTKSYCRTRLGNVTELRQFDGAWSRGSALRPSREAVGN